MISVSLDGLFAPILEGGLARADLGRLEADLRRAQHEVTTLRRADLGFIDVAEYTELIKTIKTEAKRLRSLADDLLVLGIGGSSLGGQTLTHALANTCNREVRLHYIDNIDPDRISVLLGRLDPGRTAVLVSSKSGATVETLAQLLIVRRWFRASIGQGESRSRTVFVTDPEKGLLRELAITEGIRSFVVPPEVGGRFAVLTPLGLLPAAYLGADIEKVCQGVAEMVDRVTAAADDLWQNPAAALAAGALMAKRFLGRGVLVLMPYSDALTVLSKWYVQLWGQALGKRFDRDGKEVREGHTPIAAVGTSDQYSQLQLFVDGPPDKAVVLISAAKARHPLPIPDELADHEAVSYLHKRDLWEVLTAQRRATRATLLAAGVPVIDIGIPAVDEASVGGLLALLATACAMAGVATNLDPFTQTAVEAQQRLALGLLGRDGYDEDAKRVLARESPSDTVL